MAVTAADVPSKYDLVYTVGANTYGHVFDRTRESTIYASRARAEYGYTPTFLERTNVGSAYGDDQQDFFMTESQNDWSLGQGQQFFRPSAPGGSSKYWQGRSVSSRPAGQISCQPTSVLVSFAVAPKAFCGRGAFAPTEHAAAVSNGNLYTVDSVANITDQGAHGAGVIGKRFSMCSDGQNLYIAGATSIRRWNQVTPAFSTFSATASAGSIAYLNNALYSCDGSVLKTYDGAGTATTLFTWKDATNTAIPPTANNYPKLVAFGGKLLIFHPYLINGPELWIYDGISTSRVAVLPESMVGGDCVVVNGIVFMSAVDYETPDDQAGITATVPFVQYWANGTLGTLWKGHTGTTGATKPSPTSPNMPSFCNLSGRLFWTAKDESAVYEYDLAAGAITNVRNGSLLSLAAASSASGSVMFQTASASGNIFPSTTDYASGQLSTSIFDFDNSLTKTFRSIKVVWSGSGTVDLAYTVDGVQIPGANSLQTGAVSGTEYLLPANTTGRGISVQVTLNPQLNAGHFTQTPIVARVYVRAAPALQSFRTRTYNLDLTSTPNNPTFLNDGSTSPLTGHEQATALISAITSTTPLTIVDRFGSYTGLFEPDKSTVLEIHSDSGGGVPANSGQFIASVFAREV